MCNDEGGCRCHDGCLVTPRLTFKEDFSVSAIKEEWEEAPLPTVFCVAPLLTVSLPEITACCVTVLIILMMNVDEQNGAISHAAG